MSLGAIIGIPVHADAQGQPYYSGGMRFGQCLSSLAPPMNYSTSTMLVPGKRIDVARNEIVKAALNANAEHVFFLDSDVLFPPFAFQTLLLRQRNNPSHKITSGVYWSKSQPTWPLIFHCAGRGSQMDWKVGDYIEAEYAIGMGLCLIHTDVFRAVGPDPFEINYGLHIDRETGAQSSSTLTEDLLFCEKATAKGFQIWVDTGIQAGHVDDNGVVFGLNDSMPQAQGRDPEERETLYIGDVIAGGEPGHVLSQNPALKPTWVGPPDKVPTKQRYFRVCVKDPEVLRQTLPEAAKEWARVCSGTVEILHPDYADRIAKGIPVESKALYPPGPIVEALRDAGMVDIALTPMDGYHHIRAVKPKSDDPLVSVIIVAKDLHEMTAECIQSLRRSDCEEGFEVVLVDNASEVPFASTGDRLVRTDEPLSYGDAVNLGVANANPRSVYLLLLNNDTVVTQHNWLENLLLRIRGQGQVAAVGPKQVRPEGVIYHTEIGFTPERVPFHLWAGFAHDHPNVQTEKAVLALNFGAILIRRAAFEKIPLDDRFSGIGNYEDIDWCLRVRKEGMVLVYTPSSEILHYGARTQAEDPETSRVSVEENRRRFVEKWKDEAPGLFGQESSPVPADEG